MKRNRILVAGGAGFIGSHLCDRLIQEGKNDVICVDNLFTGSKDNIRHLLGNPYFEFVRHDMTMPLYVECDQIYNLACPASPIHYQRDPIYTFKTCVLGSIHLLGLAKRTNARILQASTSEIYGNPLVNPQTEEYWGNVHSIGPRACYDEGKRAAETVFFDYYRKHGIPIKVIRIFNTYGPRMDENDGRVVSNFIVQALRGEPLTIYGDGNQTRSFCYVDDLVDAMLRMMDSPDDFTGPVNIGNPQEFSMLDFAGKIIEIVGSESKLEFRELPVDDPMQRKPDISLAKAKLNWSPRIGIDEGLSRTIAYFRERLKL